MKPEYKCTPKDSFPVKSIFALVPDTARFMYFGEEYIKTNTGKGESADGEKIELTGDTWVTYLWERRLRDVNASRG